MNSTFALANAIRDANDAGQTLFRPIKQLFGQVKGIPKPYVWFSPNWYSYSHSYKSSITVTPAIQTTTGTRRMNQHSLENQLELLHLLQKYLLELQQAFAGVSRAYEVRVQQLSEAGLSKEQYNSLVKDGLQPTQYKIKQLIQHIESHDANHTRKLIRATEDYMSKLR